MEENTKENNQMKFTEDEIQIINEIKELCIESIAQIKNSREYFLAKQEKYRKETELFKENNKLQYL